MTSDKKATTGFSQIVRQTYQLFFQAMAFLRWQGVRALLWAVVNQLLRLSGLGRLPSSRASDYEPGLVTIAILNRNRPDLIQPCLESIQANLSAKYRVEVLLGDTLSTDLEVWRFYRRSREKYANLKVVKLGLYFFSRNYNRLITRHARGQYVILLNNDTRVTPGWLDALVDPLEDKSIGVVGAKLLYPDDTVQHAGIEFNGEGYGVHVFKEEARHYPPIDIPALVPAVTFACVALRHDVFNRFRLSEDFREEAQDTDCCLRLREAKFKVLYQPQAEVYHLECASRDHTRGENDRDLLKVRWGAVIKELETRGRQRLPLSEQDPTPLITIIRDDGVGDLLAGVCAFRKMRRKYPRAHLILATYARNIKMMAGFKIFDDFIPIPDGQKYAPLPLPRAAREYNFIDFEMSFQYQWSMFIWASPQPDNMINRHFIYCRELGLEDSFELLPMPDFPEERARVMELLARRGLTPEMPFVVLNLVATNPGRSWWEPYIPSLLAAVEVLGFIPLVVGTKDSSSFVGRRLVNLVNRTPTIPEYIETVKLGRYVISTDTSAYHIAALSGIPFLAIFTGGVRPEARLNLYQQYEVAAPPHSLACYPCWDEGCRDLSVRWRGDPCRLAITPAMVIAKFKRLVAQYPRS